MVVLNVYFYFVKVFLQRKKNDKYRIAIQSLIYAHSYRIPANLNKQKAPFVYLKQSLNLIVHRTDNPHPYLKSNVTIFEANLKDAEESILYHEMITNIRNVNIIVRDLPRNEMLNAAEKMFLFILNIKISILTFFFSFFYKNSRNFSILGLELTESVILLKTLQRYKTNYLYYFSPYEKDANWIALLLKHNSIFCHKIPSSNPVKNAYSCVIADKFSFTAPFQLFEYASLKKNWIVGSFDILPNFGAQNLLNHTIEKKGNASVKSIGIYTRGIWLRKKRGDSFLGVGEDKAEENMLSFIKEFLLSQPEYITVYVLLHPTEKRTPEQYCESVNYYKDFFETINVQFVDAKTPSYELFNQFDLGIASVSSVMFERLFCGYKCLLVPVGITVKLYEDPNLENIIAHTKEDFFSKTSEILNFSNSDYFETFSLKDYRLTQTKEITF